MIVMTMIMILLPSDNCTVCLYSILLQQISSLQQLYSQSRKKGNNSPQDTFCSRQKMTPTNHFCLRGSQDNIARPITAETLECCFKSALVGQAAMIGGRGGLITELDLVSNTQQQQYELWQAEAW